MKNEMNSSYEQITDLKNSPKLKQLLTDYCLMNYQEEAIIDEHHLMAEYSYLKKNNLVHQIFECEMLVNYFKYNSEVSLLT